MSNSLSRRDALKQVALLLGVAATVRPGQSAHAADMPHLDPSDPTAKALNYTDDAKKVDPKAAAMFKPGSACSNCMQYQGKAGDAWGPCSIFAGKLVNANGWCQVYVKKA